MASRFDLGPLQDSAERLGAIQLPPWASSPFAFVATLQDAFESEIVGSHLHQWIDLVFGANQRGAGAERAGNVFPHLAYLTEPQAEALYRDHYELYLQAAEIVENFGQIPAQVALPAGIDRRSAARRTGVARSTCRRGVCSACARIGGRRAAWRCISTLAERGGASVCRRGASSA